MLLRDIAGCLRFRQWTKNITIFAALIFANHVHQTQYLVRSIAAFFLFSFGAGAVYIFNDVIDYDHDREHPVKRLRPIPSGKVSLRTAWSVSVVLALAVLGISFLFSRPFGVVMLIYMVLQVLYTLRLKKVVIVDVLTISLSFLLRVIAGAYAINVGISNWILVCTMLLALFLALSKRRHELTLLERNADMHRISLRDYSPYLLDQMIGVVTSATLVAYIIFTLSAETIEKFGNLVVTVPFVLYGIFRYLYLVHMKDKGGQPEEALLTDIPLQIDIILYGIVVVAIIYL